MTRLLQWAGKKVRWQAVALPGAVYLVVLLAGIGLSEWVRGVELGALAAIGLAAVAVCWWMITQRGHRWWYWLVITAGGVFAAVFFLQDVQVVLLGWVGKLLTLIPQMVSQRSFESLSQLDPASIEVAVLFQVLKENLSSWWSDLLAGSAAFNLQATLLVWNYAVWLLAAWLCWAVHRNWSPYISIIPVILGMSVIAAYTKKNSWILGVLMVASFGLVVFIQHYFRESQWDQREISYSVEIRIDIFILTLLISAVLVLLTLTFWPLGSIFLSSFLLADPLLAIAHKCLGLQRPRWDSFDRIPPARETDWQRQPCCLM